MTKTVVAIHQPNFFPWLGFFNKISRSDVFVLLDSVQFPKTGGTWANRAKIMMSNKADWLTMPIVRSYHGLRRIDEMQINNATLWRDKIIKTFQMNYSKAPFFKEVSPILNELVNNSTESLKEYNIAAISTLVAFLNLKAPNFIQSSNLNVNGHASDLLIGIIKAVGGTSYLYGSGARGYQEDFKFISEGINLIPQNFTHPVYSQISTKEFVPDLSIIDALMNCGFEGTCSLIQGVK